MYLYTNRVVTCAPPFSPPAISGSHTLGRKHHEQMMMAQQQQQQQQQGGHGHHPHGSATMRPMNTHTLGRLPSQHHHPHHSPQHAGEQLFLFYSYKNISCWNFIFYPTNEKIKINYLILLLPLPQFTTTVTTEVMVVWSPFPQSTAITGRNSNKRTSRCRIPRK